MYAIIICHKRISDHPFMSQKTQGLLHAKPKRHARKSDIREVCKEESPMPKLMYLKKDFSAHQSPPPLPHHHILSKSNLPQPTRFLYRKLMNIPTPLSEKPSIPPFILNPSLNCFSSGSKTNGNNSPRIILLKDLRVQRTAVRQQRLFIS
jgi:hypothetical protein